MEMKVFIITISFLLSFGLCSQYSFDNVHQYETSLINVMNDDWVKNHEVFEASTPDECLCGEHQVAADDCTCQCVSGYVKLTEDGNCTKVKEFSGGMSLNATYFNDSDARNTSRYALRDIYKNVAGFEDAKILSVKKGSIISTFLLFFDFNSDVTSDAVYETMSGACEASVLNCELTLYMMNVTRGLVCTDGTYEGYCDSVTTTCEPGPDGGVTCLCSESYYTPNTSDPSKCDDANCTRSFCDEHGACSRLQDGSKVCKCDPGWTGFNCTENPRYCDQDSQCNSPFGSCKDHACSCMWGFQGDFCYQPWMFTLTIVAAGLGLIIIILITVFACQSSKGNKKKKKNTVLDDDDSLEYDHPLENLPKADYSSYQPRMMRAQVPTHLYSSSITERPQQAPGSSTSTFNHERQETPDLARGRASYTNYGYASVDKTKRQSGRYGSPPRGSNEYF